MAPEIYPRKICLLEKLEKEWQQDYFHGKYGYFRNLELLKRNGTELRVFLPKIFLLEHV